mmetsp:Transcript_21305/g.47052  ORF Transcript_21305/g.47052 Transcript_21305/m.47052 type:complete len:289 (-) Transcript_21305:459-1325(-)
MARGMLLASNIHIFQFHDVFGEGARLVGENVRDLAEFMAEIGCSRNGAALAHDLVIGDEVGVGFVADLHSSVERHRHQVGEEHEKGDPVGEEVWQAAFRVDKAVGVEVPQATEVFLLDEVEKQVNHQGHDSLNRNGHPHRLIDDHLQIGKLHRNLPRVHHDASLIPSVDDDAHAPLHISEDRASQKHVPHLKRLLLCIAQLQGAGKGVDGFLRRLLLNFKFDVVQDPAELAFVLWLDALEGSYLRLQVRLPVQARGGNEAGPIIAKATKHHHVGGDLLLVFDDEHVPD